MSSGVVEREHSDLEPDKLGRECVHRLPRGVPLRVRGLDDAAGVNLAEHRAHDPDVVLPKAVGSLTEAGRAADSCWTR